MDKHVTDHVILRNVVDWPDVVTSGWVAEAVVVTSGWVVESIAVRSFRVAEPDIVSCIVDVGRDVLPSVVGA